MTDNLPHYIRITQAIAEVEDKLKSRPFGGFWRIFPGGHIRLGQDYMDGTRTLILHCCPLMKPEDLDRVHDAYNEARASKLVTSNMSGIRRFRGAIRFRRLSKESYEIVKVTSNRLLDDRVAGPLGRKGPPAGAPHTTPEGLNRTDPPAGASTTPGEFNTCPPHDSFTDSRATATSSIPVWTQDIEITLSSGTAGSGVPMDEILETYSFVYDPDLATSDTSIASYKTEKSVNSRKSRYNILPRHKFADHGYSRPQGPGSLDDDDASVPKTELRDEHIDDSDESPSSPQNAPPNSPGPSLGTPPLDGPSTTPPNTKPVHADTQSQPPGPQQGVELLTAKLAGLMGGTQEVESVSDVDLFGSDSEAGAD